MIWKRSTPFETDSKISYVAAGTTALGAYESLELDSMEVVTNKSLSSDCLIKNAATTRPPSTIDRRKESDVKRYLRMPRLNSSVHWCRAQSHPKRMIAPTVGWIERAVQTYLPNATNSGASASFERALQASRSRCLEQSCLGFKKGSNSPVAILTNLLSPPINPIFSAPKTSLNLGSCPIFYLVA